MLRASIRPLESPFWVRPLPPVEIVRPVTVVGLVAPPIAVVLFLILPFAWVVPNLLAPEADDPA